ncbi:hypothetical protein FS749_011733 [Ceratobasidium sp. UAMH 11750]|nr:hypothetical protein FS749_011733 [Ceratobasidium sp. UAMH 11750]
MRGPCADCRGCKCRCVHDGDGKDDAAGTGVDAPDDSIRTGHESDVVPRSRLSHLPLRWALYPQYYAPHARFPPAPDIRHPMPGGPSRKECRARSVPCTRLGTRADDSGSPADSIHAAPVPPAAPGAKGATPAPAPASCGGCACLACHKLKMRSVALNGENGNASPDGLDERR